MTSKKGHSVPILQLYMGLPAPVMFVITVLGLASDGSPSWLILVGAQQRPVLHAGIIDTDWQSKSYQHFVSEHVGLYLL
jgi:hypothetical protein